MKVIVYRKMHQSSTLKYKLLVHLLINCLFYSTMFSFSNSYSLLLVKKKVLYRLTLYFRSSMLSCFFSVVCFIFILPPSLPQVTLDSSFQPLPLVFLTLFLCLALTLSSSYPYPCPLFSFLSASPLSPIFSYISTLFHSYSELGILEIN